MVGTDRWAVLPFGAPGGRAYQIAQICLRNGF
jgi:hypothetical protein